MARCPPSHGSCPGSSLLRRAPAALRCAEADGPGGSVRRGDGTAGGKQRPRAVPVAGAARAGRQSGSGAQFQPGLLGPAARPPPERLGSSRPRVLSHGGTLSHTGTPPLVARVTHTLPLLHRALSRSRPVSHARLFPRALGVPPRTASSGEARQLSHIRCLPQPGHTPSTSHAALLTPCVSHGRSHSRCPAHAAAQARGSPRGHTQRAPAPRVHRLAGTRRLRFRTRGAAPGLLPGPVTPAHTRGTPPAHGRGERSRRRARAAACARLRETRGPSLRPLWQRCAATAGPAARPRSGAACVCSHQTAGRAGGGRVSRSRSPRCPPPWAGSTCRRASPARGNPRSSPNFAAALFVPVPDSPSRADAEAAARPPAEAARCSRRPRCERCQSRPGKGQRRPRRGQR